MKARTCLGCVAVLVLGFLALTVAGVNVLDRATTSTRTGEQKPTPQPRPSTGQEGHVLTNTMASATKDGRGAVTSAMVAGDTHGLAQLVASGQAFVLDGGTRILVLEKSWTVVRVRALDGQNRGRAGWIPSEHYGR